MMKMVLTRLTQLKSHKDKSVSAKRNWRTVLKACTSAAVALAFLQACGGSGSKAPGNQVGNSYLFVSVPDFYFGTRDVGTSSTQEIEIANRGADLYPLNSVSIKGENSEEFVTDIYDDIVLQPAQAIKVRVTFAPITDGRKFANLVVDYDTIHQVEESVNINEQNYYKAKDLEKSGDYQGAQEHYSDYIAGKPVTTNKQRAAIKLPVINESAIYGGEEVLHQYLRALDARESGEFEFAEVELDVLVSKNPDSYLADDALYLQGYMQLMDRRDYKAALITMQNLREQFPDTTYYDTALYSEALAHQELGHDELARRIFVDLRERHTGIDTLGIQLPKDTIVSRLWFDRATEALKTLDS